MNKRCKAIDREEYEKIIEAIQNGFVHKGVHVQQNKRIAAALITEANTGMRIGDVLQLRLSKIVHEAGRYHLDVIEEKTGKRRTFTLASEVVNFLQAYALERGIRPTAKLFDITERAIQKRLKATVEYLGLEGTISTHSFRKFFATNIYVSNHFDIALVRELLQHSSVSVTQRYLGVSNQMIEKALQKHVYIP